MFTEQRFRAVLYYSCVLVFFLGLPYILSYSLGYKFDRKTLKLTQTGLIYVKTQPQGASIYLNDKLTNEKTPAGIKELLPGPYHVRVELENYYSWSGDVWVQARKVVLLEKIILFPLRPDIKQVNKDAFDNFIIEEDRGLIYYANFDDSSIYVSDLEGGHYKRMADFIYINPAPLKWKFSPDRQKLVYFNKHKIGVTYLDVEKEKALSNGPFILDYPQSLIIDVFWHSDNYHLVVVSDKNIEVFEAKPKAQPVELAKLNKKDTQAYYNFREDALYFMDLQKLEDGSSYENLYQIDLNARALIEKTKNNE